MQSNLRTNRPRSTLTLLTAVQINQKMKVIKIQLSGGQAGYEFNQPDYFSGGEDVVVTPVTKRRVTTVPWQPRTDDPFVFISV
ncbi:Hypothetical protein NTJ_10502 [Nesidiocoris tenuis]|nr:Hypothetical protein NTJ_10502 [Nesidiocoris tenuis]